MQTKNLTTVLIGLAVLTLLGLFASCATEDATPVIIEKEVLVTVEVEKMVEKEVAVTVEVEKMVEVEKEVAVTVEVEKMVEVEKEVVVTVEVEKIVLATREAEEPGGSELLSPEEPQPGGTLHIGKEGQHAYELFSWQAEMWRPDSVSHNGLIRVSHDLTQLLPDLATGWDVSEDGKTYTFYLRRDARWHDGEPFRAADVIWSYTANAHPEGGAAYGGPRYMSGVVGYSDLADGTSDELAGLTAIDDHTLQIEFTSDTPSNVWLLAYVMIFPEHILGGTPWADIPAHPYWTKMRIGTGPFKFVSFTPQQSIVYVRNDDFWGQKPYIDRIVFHLFDNATTALAALEKGEIDAWYGYASVPIDEVPRFEAMPHVNVLPGPSGVTQYIQVYQANPDFPWAAMKEFRQAVAYCIDKDLLIETMWASRAKAMHGPILQEKYWSPDAPTYDYDPEKGKELLESIGYDYDLEIQLSYYYASKFFDDLMAAIQAQLAECGIKVNPLLLDGPTLTALDAKWNQSGGPMFAYGAAGVPLFPDQFLTYFADEAPPDGVNKWAWHNDRYTELFDEYKLTSDEETRIVQLQELDQIAAEEQIFIWLWSPERPPGVNVRLQNSRWGPTYVPYDMGIEDWWLSQ